MLPQEEDLLLRSTCYAAEAPVGYELYDSTLLGPSAVYVQEPPPPPASAQDEVGSVNVSYRTDSSGDAGDVPTPEECERAETLRNDDVLGDFTTFVACQRNGDDGVTVFRSCRPHRNNLYWDSRSNPRLCYGFRGRIATGPCTRNCKGRCGIGCGNSKRGFYTRDCAEHDDCSGRANGPGFLGGDRNCGDEYSEARGDFLRRYHTTCRNCYR